MDAQHSFSIIDQLAEVEREIRRRKKFYPSWVKSGCLTIEAAAQSINKLMAVAETLRAIYQLATSTTVEAQSSLVESQPAE